MTSPEILPHALLSGVTSSANSPREAGTCSRVQVVFGRGLGDQERGPEKRSTEKPMPGCVVSWALGKMCPRMAYRPSRKWEPLSTGIQANATCVWRDGRGWAREPGKPREHTDRRAERGGCRATPALQLSLQPWPRTGRIQGRGDKGSRDSGLTVCRRVLSASDGRGTCFFSPLFC